MKPLEAGDEWVGPYRLLAELGAGGMGRVYLASGPDGALVAVKRIDPRYAADEGFRVRFGREVDACRRVSGAYTASVITADPDARTPWLASVYVQGPSLAQVLETAGVLPEEPVVQLAARLASALVDIHRAGLVHRDLKPSNVLLADDGLRVIDFGIVRAVGNPDVTLAALPVGSPSYMSPEQAQGRPVTTASDMFSLGVLLVVACTGRNPFHVPGDVHATMRNVVHSQPDLAPVPDRLRPIVERCLVKDPAGRPTPAQVLALIGTIAPTSRPWPPAVYDLIARQRASLDRLLRGEPEPGSEPEQTQVMSLEPDPGPSFEPPDGTPPQNDPPPPPPRSRSRAPLIAVLSVIGVVLAVLAAFGIYRGWDSLVAQDEPTPSPSQTSTHSPSPTPTPTLTPTENEPVVPPIGEIVGYGDRCLDVAAGGTADGTPVQMYACNHTAAQQWTLAPDGTLRAFGKCLDVNAGATENGTKVHLWECHGGPNQKWTSQDGLLIDGNSGRCLDDPLDTPDGTQLQIWDCHGGANQQWRLPS